MKKLRTQIFLYKQCPKLFIPEAPSFLFWPGFWKKFIKVSASAVMFLRTWVIKGTKFEKYLLLWNILVAHLVKTYLTCPWHDTLILYLYNPADKVKLVFSRSKPGRELITPSIKYKLNLANGLATNLELKKWQGYV